MDDGIGALISGSYSGTKHPVPNDRHLHIYKAFCLRAITHSIYQPYLERVAAYQKAMRKRQVWIEPKFSESKLRHQGRRFRLRRIHKVNIEALLRASVQNLKQLLREEPPKPPFKPVSAQALVTPMPTLLARAWSFFDLIFHPSIFSRSISEMRLNRSATFSTIWFLFRCPRVQKNGLTFAVRSE